MKKLITVLKNRVVHTFVFFVPGIYSLILSYKPGHSTNYGGYGSYGGGGGWSGMKIDPVFFCIGAALILASWISYKKWTFESISKKNSSH